MTATAYPRLNNVLLIVLILLVLVMLAVMVYHIATDNQPAIRPGSNPRQAPKEQELPGAWWEKFGEPEVFRLDRTLFLV